MTDRLSKVRQELLKKGLDAMIISQPENRRYLSGFTGSAGYLFITKNKAVLATDFRYIQQAKEESPDFEIFRMIGDINQWLPEILLNLDIKKMGFESRHITFASYQQFADVIKKTGKNIDFISIDTLVEHLRAVKDDLEIAYISRAANLADNAFNYFLSIIHPGMTEKEAAWRIERFLRENDSESIPFEIIMASGSHSALPHAQPSDRKFLSDEPIMFDFGAKVAGYCSDLTRTVCLSRRRNKRFSEIYSIVLEAQTAAINNIRANMDLKEADNIGRTIIQHHGYGDFFGHSLGHGIGLATHENPVLGPNSSGNLTDNMIFTIEPGIYLNDWGGVRIEDTVILKNGKVEVLSKAQKLSAYVKFEKD